MRIIMRAITHAENEKKKTDELNAKREPTADNALFKTNMKIMWVGFWAAVGYAYSMPSRSKDVAALCLYLCVNAYAPLCVRVRVCVCEVRRTLQPVHVHKYRTIK